MPVVHPDADGVSSVVLVLLRSTRNARPPSPDQLRLIPPMLVQLPQCTTDPRNFAVAKEIKGILAEDK